VYGIPGHELLVTFPTWIRASCNAESAKPGIFYTETPMYEVDIQLTQLRH
jgi:hypothetical protein